jgi:hypothetical protein
LTNIAAKGTYILNRLKCDRAQPCNTCEHRGVSQSCSYVQSISPRSNADALAPTAIAEMQDVVSEFESLVTRLGVKAGAAEEIATILERVCSMARDILRNRLTSMLGREA